MSSWDPAERDRVAALCEEHGIHTVECVFVDTWGMPRGKRLPVRQFLRGSGFAIANVVYTWDPTCFIFGTPWVDETDGFPDMHAIPDLASFRVAGWTDGVGIVMCDTVNVETREPIEMDARQMLKRQLARAEDLGVRRRRCVRARVPLLHARLEADLRRHQLLLHLPRLGDGARSCSTSASRCARPASRSRRATSSTALGRPRSTCGTGR